MIKLLLNSKKWTFNKFRDIQQYIKNKKNYQIAVWILMVIPIIFIIIVWFKEKKCPFTHDYNTDQWASILAALLGYIGTSALGILALWQNDKLSEVNEKYRILTIVPFLTFLDNESLVGRYIDGTNYVSQDIKHKKGAEIKFENSTNDQYIYIEGDFINESEYPITSISSKLELCVNNLIYINYSLNTNIYIGSKKNFYLRFIFPQGIMSGHNEECILIKLVVSNSLGFNTKSEIEMRRNKINKLLVNYRIMQYTDINSNKPN